MKNARLPMAPGAGAKGEVKLTVAQSKSSDALPQPPCHSVRSCHIEVSGTTFQFAEGGIAALCADVPDGAGRTIDRVAWAISREDRWFLERGVPVVAGEDALRRADWYAAPVILVATPAEWRRQRDAGNIQSCCILDPWADFERLLGCHYVHAAPDLKRKLDKIQREKIMRRALPVSIEPAMVEDIGFMLDAFRAVIRQSEAHHAA
jgi:hypothetical protein